jgi:hypothetical protein
LSYVEDNRQYILDFIDETEVIKNEEKDDFIEFLFENDFFQLPASIKFHSNYTGGLADHSVKTEKNLIMLLKTYGVLDDYELDYVRLAGLFHDLCKIDRYEKIKDREEPTRKQKKFLKSLFDRHRDDLVERGITNKVLKLKTFKTKNRFSNLISWLSENPEGPPPAINVDVWKYKEDPLLFGHGEKSVLFLQKHIFDLPEYVILAIRWHMGAWKKDGVEGLLNKARKKYDIVKIIALADQMATIGEDIHDRDIDELNNINVNQGVV